MNRIKEEIRDSFKKGTTLTKLIYINLGAFVLIWIPLTLLKLFNVSAEWSTILQLPAGLSRFIYTPWTILTYMFFHLNFIPLIINILILYWFGKLFIRFFSQRDLVGLYLLGGIAGGIFFIIAYNLFPYFAPYIKGSYLLGASASVLAVIVATAVIAPNYPIRLALIAEFKLKWLAIGCVVISFLNITTFQDGQLTLTNPSGQIAHLGGALMGYLFASQYKRGKNITSWINLMLDKAVNLFRRKPRLKVTHQRPLTDQEYNFKKKQERENVDRILEKIKIGGYESLSKEEKEELFRASQK